MPEYRRKGLGRQVFEHIKDEANKHDIRALHLEVARSNSNAQKLYSRANFVVRDKYLLMTATL
jgi:ribosomal protein S18 acetylase RimI-like enzyme